MFCSTGCWMNHVQRWIEFLRRLQRPDSTKRHHEDNRKKGDYSYMHTRWCPSSLAKLVHITSMNMVYGWYYIYTYMALKPTYNCGTPPCTSYGNGLCFQKLGRIFPLKILSWKFWFPLLALQSLPDGYALPMQVLFSSPRKTMFIASL